MAAQELGKTHHLKSSDNELVHQALAGYEDAFDFLVETIKATTRRFSSR